jgi:hypothetical protein
MKSNNLYGVFSRAVWPTASGSLQNSISKKTPESLNEVMGLSGNLGRRHMTVRRYTFEHYAQICSRGAVCKGVTL